MTNNVNSQAGELQRAPTGFENPWKPTEEQDMAPAPEWAAVINSHPFRSNGAGPRCRKISREELPPVLIHRSRRSPRHPAYVVSEQLWKVLCEQVSPADGQIGNLYTGRDFRNEIGSIMEHAYESGVHSFVRSSEKQFGYRVVFSPRLWVEEAMRKLMSRPDRNVTMTLEIGGKTRLVTRTAATLFAQYTQLASEHRASTAPDGVAHLKEKVKKENRKLAEEDEALEEGLVEKLKEEKEQILERSRKVRRDLQREYTEDNALYLGKLLLLSEEKREELERARAAVAKRNRRAKRIQELKKSIELESGQLV